MRRKQGNESGFALIAVLWALVLLGVVASDFYAAGAADRSVTANIRAAARGRWMARAGLAHTLDDLHTLLTSDSASLLMSATEAVILSPPDLVRDRVRVGAVVMDSRALLPLNAATAVELRRLATAAGVREGDALRLARAVEEWRGLQPGTRIQSVEAVRSLDGVTVDAYLRVAPFLTVGGDGRVNVNTAPPAVLQAALGVDESTARAIVARRERQPLANAYELLEMLPRIDRAAAQADVARLTERLAFFPRDVDILVRAEPEGSPIRVELHARVALNGGQLTIIDLVER